MGEKIKRGACIGRGVAVKPLVAVVMGSDSDEGAMAETEKALNILSIPYEARIMSAHRSPMRVSEYVINAPKRGIKIFIAGAGAAAHLAGIMASHTILPVIGVPLSSSSLDGVDALFATVQMPRGIPVATLAVGAGGAFNAGLLAGQILAIQDASIRKRLLAYRKQLASSVKEKDRIKHRKSMLNMKNKGLNNYGKNSTGL